MNKKINQYTLFSKIINREISADIVYQDEFITAFRDILPQAPVHILIVPNLLITSINEIMDDHIVILGKLFIVASKIAKMENIDKTGYRLIVNCNKHAGQEIFHVHMHLLGGKFLGPLLT